MKSALRPSTFFRTLYAKQALVFSLMILLVGAFQAYSNASNWMQFQLESEQRLNWHVAEKIANRVQLFSKDDSIEYQALSDAVGELLVPPAQFDLYLLNSKGRIIYQPHAASSVVHSQVPLAPIRRFLRQTNISGGAIVGTDPRKKTRKAVFSVAPITLGSEGGYVYVVLGRNQYATILDVLRESYIIRTSVYSIIGSLFAALVIGLLAFFYLSRPLTNVLAVVRRFASGDFEARAHATSGDEIQMLAEGFNELADTLSSAITKLQEQEKLRKELVGNIAHDLRSPVAAVRALVETTVLRSDEMKAEQRNNQLGIAINSLDSLQQLVDELFQLSTLEAGAHVLDEIEFDLNELLEALVKQNTLLAQQRELTLHFVPSPGEAEAWVYADFTLISKVIANLLSNAMRYTESGGEVFLESQAQEQGFEVRVRDTGIGISEDDVARIFQRFYRAEKSRNRKTGGTGLGLAIVKGALEAHGISLRVESALGKGSCFSFVVPRADI